MTSLETQVAKIQLGNFKHTTSYVSVFAEQVPSSGAELYAVCELPLFNPAALSDCEQIAQALSATLKRCFRARNDAETFEQALAEINEELGKLAGLGKQYWVGKLNALIAVKHGSRLHIATTGKISALLYRDDAFTNLADNAPSAHPLKTFENFAIGKVKLDDILVFSTNQLFNYISIDRLKQLLATTNLPLAGKQLIQLLQDNAGPEVAFGTLVTQQVTPGTTSDEQLDLAEYQPSASLPQAGLAAGIVTAFRTIGRLLLKLSNYVREALLYPRKTKRLAPITEEGMQEGQLLTGLRQSLYSARERLSWGTIKQLSRTKKFFLISASVLLLALLVNVIVARQFAATKQQTEELAGTFTAVQNNLNDANAAILYRDEQHAGELAQKIKDQLAALGELPKSKEAERETLANQLRELEDKLERRTTVTATQVGSLSQANQLLALPPIFATAANNPSNTIVSFNPTTGTVEDTSVLASGPILDAVYVSGTRAVAYNEQGLQLWNFQQGLFREPFTENVPKPADAVGLVFYSENNRTYTLDKTNRRIVSFLVGETNLSKPIVAISNIEAANEAQDIAIDGSIYVLAGSTIRKYQSGKPAAFTMPTLVAPLSNSGRLYTNRATKNLYVLDRGNKRILILDKKGPVVANLFSNELTAPTDFVVDEPNKTIYVLNDTALLKISF
jgi:hypothetical protein